jgi:prepilin-type N-terminal cleavage/methylation domain-containing protein
MKSVTRHRLSHPGFTLVELLVSLTILTIMLFSLAQAVAYVSQLWINGVGAIDNISKARDIVTVMDRDIQQMVLRPDTAAFVGSNTSTATPACAFYTNVQSSGTDTRAVSLVQYELNPPGSPSNTSSLGRLTYGMNFSSTITPIISTPAPTALTQLASASTSTETLATGVVQFQYQFVDGAGTILTPQPSGYIPYPYTGNATTPFTYDYINPRDPANPRAVIVSIIVLSNSAYKIATQAGLLSKLTDGTTIFSTAAPTNQTYSQVWNTTLSNPNAAFLSLPGPVRAGLRVFQRYIPLPVISPES